MKDKKIDDKQSFELLYQQYVAELIQYSMRLTLNKELVKDVIQDTFTHLWQTRERLETIKSVKAYLITCVRREIIKRIKAGRLNGYEVEDTSMRPVGSPEELLMQSQHEQFRSKKIMEEVSRLPLRQQEVIFLRFYSELEFLEIARIMNIRQRSVYKVLYKALNNLKVNLTINMFQQ